MSYKAAKEQTTTTRSTYIQSPRLIGGHYKVTLRDFRDLVAATEDYDPNSKVILESTSIQVVETKRSGYIEKGRS